MEPVGFFFVLDDQSMWRRYWSWIHPWPRPTGWTRPTPPPRPPRSSSRAAFSSPSPHPMPVCFLCLFVCLFASFYFGYLFSSLFSCSGSFWFWFFFIFSFSLFFWFFFFLILFFLCFGKHSRVGIVGWVFIEWQMFSSVWIASILRSTFNFSMFGREIKRVACFIFYVYLPRFIVHSVRSSFCTCIVFYDLEEARWTVLLMVSRKVVFLSSIKQPVFILFISLYHPPQHGQHVHSGVDIWPHQRSGAYHSGDVFQLWSGTERIFACWLFVDLSKRVHVVRIQYRTNQRRGAHLFWRRAQNRSGTVGFLCANFSNAYKSLDKFSNSPVNEHQWFQIFKACVIVRNSGRFAPSSLLLTSFFFH